MSIDTTIAEAEAETSDRELVFTRTYAAPRELVYEAWTDPKHVARWWGPSGFTTTIEEMDVRPGGVWRLVMHGPDGVDYRNRIVFIEVVRPERLVYKHDPEKGSEPVSFHVTVTFTEQGGCTQLTMRMLFPSPAVRDHVAQKYGAIEGAEQTLARLAEQLGTMSRAGAHAIVPDLVITRLFDAPIEVVFKAWTDSDSLQRWWGPKGFTNPRCEVDVRAGGAIRIDMRAPDGVVYPMIGEFREVHQPDRLVFTSGALDELGVPLFEILNTVLFEAEGGKTRLTLRAGVLTATAKAAPYLGGMEQGWSQSLDRLAEEC